MGRLLRFSDHSIYFYPFIYLLLKTVSLCPVVLYNVHYRYSAL